MISDEEGGNAGSLERTPGVVMRTGQTLPASHGRYLFSAGGRIASEPQIVGFEWADSVIVGDRALSIGAGSAVGAGPGEARIGSNGPLEFWRTVGCH